MLKEKLQDALKINNSNPETYIWKGAKKTVAGEIMQPVTKLVDASVEQLREFHAYCQTMLHNKQKGSLGRYHVLKIIADQRMKTNAELFLRSLEATNVSRYSLIDQIKEIAPTDIHNLTIKDISSNCPDEYSKLPISVIMNACQGKLGVFDKKYLTLTFILKQGVYLTNEELIDLIERKPNGKLKNRLNVIRDRLGISPNVRFILSDTGLSYAQLRALFQIKKRHKYSEMTTPQLHVLRDRILFELENEVNIHIQQWEKRKAQIEEVLALKGATL